MSFELTELRACLFDSFDAASDLEAFSSRMHRYLLAEKEFKWQL